MTYLVIFSTELEICCTTPEDPRELGKFAILNKNTSEIARNISPGVKSRANKILEYARRRWGDKLVDICLAFPTNYMITKPELAYLIFAYAPFFVFVTLKPTMNINYERLDPARLIAEEYEIPSLDMMRKWCEESFAVPQIVNYKDNISQPGHMAVRSTAIAGISPGIPMPKDRRFTVRYIDNSLTLLNYSRHQAATTILRPNDIPLIHNNDKVALLLKPKNSATIPFSNKTIEWILNAGSHKNSNRPTIRGYRSDNENIIALSDYKFNTYPIFNSTMAPSGVDVQTMIGWATPIA